MSNVIDFRTGKSLPQQPGKPPRQIPPDGSRQPKFVVEFFDDVEFPLRFKGIETSAPFLRECAADFKMALMGILEIAYEMDPDPSQRVRLMGFVFDDGSAFCDVYNPPSQDERKQYDWLLSRIPAIRQNLQELKERECSRKG